MANVEPLLPVCDEYGEVLNHPETFDAIAQSLQVEGSVLIGWTDGSYTHFDALLTLGPHKFGNIQRGLHHSESLLFVSVIGLGVFGFDCIRSEDLHPGYVGEKLRLGENVTTTALTELLNEVIKRIGWRQGEATDEQQS